MSIETSFNNTFVSVPKSGEINPDNSLLFDLLDQYNTEQMELCFTEQLQNKICFKDRTQHNAPSWYYPNQNFEFKKSIKITQFNFR
jgi:hypothetical protein